MKAREKHPRSIQILVSTRQIPKTEDTKTGEAYMTGIDRADQCKQQHYVNDEEKNKIFHTIQMLVDT